MNLIIKIILFSILCIALNCKSGNVKEEEPDEILEEELRAEAEPIREIKERDFKEEVKKPSKKR